MKKRVILILCVVLLLVACGSKVPQGSTARDTAAVASQVRTGTQGVEIRTLPDLPPSTIYDSNELVALVEIQNRGNHNLEGQDCFVHISGFDTNIISGGFDLPRSCAEGIGTLEGKNLFNPEGSINQLEFLSTNIQLPQGVFEYSPPLNFVTCYNYHTKASPSVCIDPLLYQITPDQKACDYRQSVSVGGGQGAPVGVTYVNVDMIGGIGGKASRAIFEIDVRNMGKGRVMSPHTDLRVCAEDASLRHSDFDRVLYTVQLSGRTLTDCKPRDGFVRLHNNQGKIVCTMPVTESYAFETPLLVDLDYNYIQSLKKEVRVIKTPQ